MRLGGLEEKPMTRLELVKNLAINLYNIFSDDKKRPDFVAVNPLSRERYLASINATLLYVVWPDLYSFLSNTIQESQYREFLLYDGEDIKTYKNLPILCIPEQNQEFPNNEINFKQINLNDLFSDPKAGHRFLDKYFIVDKIMNLCKHTKYDIFIIKDARIRFYSDIFREVILSNTTDWRFVGDNEGNKKFLKELNEKIFANLLQPSNIAIGNDLINEFFDKINHTGFTPSNFEGLYIEWKAVPLVKVEGDYDKAKLGCMLVGFVERITKYETVPLFKYFIISPVWFENDDIKDKITNDVISKLKSMFMMSIICTRLKETLDK
jgi:hypothetical protein